MNVNNGTERQLTKGSIYFEAVAWSADGKVLLASNAENIYLVEVSGDGQPILFEKNATDIAVSFDGNMVAFVSTDDQYMMNFDRTNLRKIVASKADYREPSWSPDGSKIVFVGDSPSPDLFVIDLQNGTLMSLTNNDFPEAHPVWSPDGSKIVFASRREFDWDIYVINIDGTGLTQLTKNYRDDIEPSWSPDGLSIAYLSDLIPAYTVYEVEVMNVDGSRLVHFTSQSSTGMRSPVWRPVPGVSIPSPETPALTATPTIQLTP